MNDAALSARLRAWMPAFVRAVRTFRLYPSKSAMRGQQLDIAVRELLDISKNHGAFSLGIRDGTILFADDPIFLDDDLKNGVSHLLAGNSIFELSFDEWCDPADFEKLVAILAEDEGHRPRTGEDLVTLLWRHHLPHIRYRFVDVLSVSVRTDNRPDPMRALVQDAETERLRKELRRMVTALSIDEATGEDTIAVIDAQLETPEACRLAAAQDQRRFDSAIAMNENRVSARMIDALRADVRSSSTHDALSMRLADLLLDALRSEADPNAGSPALTLLLRLFDAMLNGEDFLGATRMVERVRAIAQNPRNALEQAFVLQLITDLSHPTPLDKILRALDRTEDTRSANKIIGLLRALGQEVMLNLFSVIDSVENANAREVLCALAIELSETCRPDRLNLMRTSRPEIAAQLLRAATACDADAQAELIAVGVVHPSPIVRAQALRSLARFAPGRPDEMFAKAVHDPDPKVRALAIRSIAVRRSQEGARHIAQLLQRSDVLDRDPAELRLMLVTFGAVGRALAVTELERLLTKASSLTSGHKSAVVEAIALGLSVVDADPARDLLAKGARSLNPKLRSACKLALEEGGRRELARIGALAGTDGGPVQPKEKPWFAEDGQIPALSPDALRPVWPESRVPPGPIKTTRGLATTSSRPMNDPYAAPADPSDRTQKPQRAVAPASPSSPLLGPQKTKSGIVGIPAAPSQRPLPSAVSRKIAVERQPSRPVTPPPAPPSAEPPPLLPEDALKPITNDLPPSLPDDALTPIQDSDP